MQQFLFQQVSLLIWTLLWILLVEEISPTSKIQKNKKIENEVILEVFEFARSDEK
jgi:hypothetical protein